VLLQHLGHAAQRRGIQSGHVRDPGGFNNANRVALRQWLAGFWLASDLLPSFRSQMTH
jgi:hypothetical protein